MFDKARKKIQFFSNDEKGAILGLALIFFAVGVVLIVPLLSFMASGYTTTSRVYDEKASELYAADAGIREAIWNLNYNYAKMPNEINPPYSITLDGVNKINNKKVKTTITYLPEVTTNKTYKIESTATSTNGSVTHITTYAILPINLNYSIFQKAIASGTNIRIKKNGSVINGPMAYEGSIDLHKDFFYDPDGDPESKDPIPGPENLQFPTNEEDAIFVSDMKTRAQKLPQVPATSMDLFTGGNLGPKYIDGDLVLDAEGVINLTGVVYVKGTLRAKKSVTFVGQGAIIVENSENAKNAIDLDKGVRMDSEDPDSFITLVAINGHINFDKEAVVLNGLIYAPDGAVNIKKEGSITGSIVAKYGVDCDMKVNVDYHAFIEESVLVDYIYNPAQFQTWDIANTVGLSIYPSILPDGDVGIAYPALILNASGGDPPYTWSKTGTMPPGLSLGSDGVISGTPSLTGIYKFTLTVSDSSGKTKNSNVSITINNAPEISSNSPLPSGNQGSVYFQKLAVSQGSAPFTWEHLSGSLPTGLSIDSSGRITGIPEELGIFNFTVLVTDRVGASDAKLFSLTINPALSPLEITTTALPDGIRKSSYNQTLTGSGGIKPYTWELYSGTLPNGLSLSSEGVISGTLPNDKDVEYTFTVKLIDDSGDFVTKEFSFIVLKQENA